jgi:hypothetical protein
MAMTWVPDACTLPTEQVPLRVAEFNDLFARALRSLRRLEPTWLRLGLADAPGIEATVADLVARETACCSFFDFTLTHGNDGELWVDVRVPAGRQAVLDGLARQATASAPTVQA